MKYSKLLLMSALAVLLAFSSCKKEEISEVEEQIEQVEPETTTNNVLVGQMQSSSINTDGLDLGCFSVDFPFDLVVDGTTVNITSNEDFEAALSDDAVYVDFAYPLNITYPDGETDSVADGEALGEAFASCIPGSGWGEDVFPAFLITELNSCYEMVYPVNLVDSDGNISIANDEDEFVDLIANNYDLSFQFPLTLLNEDGNEVTADNDEALFELLFECDEFEDPGTGTDPFNECWDYVYPFEMLDQDGNVVVINNHDDICNAMLNGLILEHIYPLTLVNAAGEELVVNNEDELSEAWLDCFPGGPGIDLDLTSFILNSDFVAGQTCYAVNYPLAYTNSITGDTGTIADADAAQAYLDGSTGEWGDVIDFPVTVTELSTGDQVSIESFDAYFEFLFNCQ